MAFMNPEFGGVTASMPMVDIASQERMMVRSTEPFPPPAPNVVQASMLPAVTTFDAHCHTVAIPAIGPAVASAGVEERSAIPGIKEDEFCPLYIDTMTSIVISVRPVPATTNHRTPAVFIASMITHWPHAMASASMVN